MAIELKKYESKAPNTIGTVSSIIGKGGTLEFVPGTWDSGKRITVILANKKGESGVVSCSKLLSRTLRKAKDNKVAERTMLAVISKLEISEDDKDRNFIISPRGNGGKERENFTIEELSKEDVEFDDVVF